jgi:hypothetical protein
MPTPTAVPTDIDAIAQMQDGALRNLLITQRYHDLSACLVETIGPGNVNWSTFATWASKTAGLSIRNEEVPPVLDQLAGDQLFLFDPVREVLGTVSTSIAVGNRKVYAELAPLFAKFVRIFRDSNGGAADIEAFVGSLDPRPSSTDGGQAPLRPAFRAYYDAIGTTDATKKARLMLLGNCLIGQHEQTRLDPQIQEAMDAPIDDLVEKYLKPGKGGGLIARLEDAIERPIEAWVTVAKMVWEEIATRLMMSLSLPGGQLLPLGKNIPAEAAGRPFLPEALRDIDAPADVVALLEEFDRAHGDGDDGSASIDWRVLNDRMNFIVNLFRSRQQDLELLGPPFSADQRAAFEAGKMPDPTLGKL